MNYNKLRQSLYDTSWHEENQQEIIEFQIDHIRRMNKLRDYPHLVAMDLLHAGICVVNTEEGADGLATYADHLRGMASQIDAQINRSKIHTV